MPKTVLIYKNLGETPLEALERFRLEQINAAREKSDQNLVTLWQSIPMTYAGRLDPMAEGELLILIGDECKNKEKYLRLDKEYEVEILFGMTTDTHDILGLVTKLALITQKVRSENNSHAGSAKSPTIDLSKYVGKFTQPYPAYSSKTVNGKQLHELARADELPEKMPEKQVEIYSLSKVGPWTKITAQELQTRILKSIDLVKGDFRQVEIKTKWRQALSDQNQSFDVITVKVKCSSGTYMRSLAHKIGQDSGCGAMALSIKRMLIC